MENLLEIRRRIRNIKEIRHITRAMKMVAATHLKRSQQRVADARPFARKISEVLGDLYALSPEERHPLMEVRPVRRVLYIVITSDKGLAGAYNQSIIRAWRTHRDSLPGNPAVVVLAVGRKGRNFFRRTGIEMCGEFTGISHRPAFSHAVRLAGQVMAMHRAREIDEVYIVYSRFHSASIQEPRCFRLLPMIPPDANPAAGKVGREWIFEPSPFEILEHLIPRYIETELFRALLEADAGERGARMTSMAAASDNADTMIGELVLKYNHVRQAIITREITELAGGAELVRSDIE